MYLECTACKSTLDSQKSIINVFRRKPSLGATGFCWSGLSEILRFVAYSFAALCSLNVNLLSHYHQQQKYPKGFNL